jgi:prepilin-type N-terminal cleavage/methylation domain-containing protein
MKSLKLFFSSAQVNGKFFSKVRRGFTLIELLVVVAIIGLLASVVIVSIQSARMKGRDARRIADFAQIRTALELYVDTNSYYPQGRCGWDSNCGGTWTLSSDSTTWGAFATLLAPYISALPKDPLNTSGCAPWDGSCYTYAYGDVGRYTYKSTYNLTAQLEDPNSQYRCGIKDYRWAYGQNHWCTAFGGGYSNQIYDVSPN